VSDDTGGFQQAHQTEPDPTAPSLLQRIRHGRLVGRDQQVAEARAWLERAAAGEGSILLVSGEPGIGKTRFIQELTRQAHGLGFLPFLGACYAEGGAAYGPITQMVRAAFRMHPAAASHLPEFPYTAVSGDSPGAGAFDSLVAPVLEQHQILETVAGWLEQVCAQTPVLLVLEDVHWASSPVLELFRHLARLARHLPLVMALTFRPGEVGAPRLLDEIVLDLNRQRLAVRFPLSRLSQPETQALLTSMRIETLPPGFIENLHRQTEGNPFFVEEVCKDLFEEGHLQNHGGRWILTDSAVIKIPRSVRSAIQARVARLSPAAQDVLRLAAIQGHAFDYEVLKRSSSQEEEKILQALEDAVSAFIIDEAEAGPGEAARFRFVHVLIPVTLRESIIRLRRQNLHRQVAQAIEALSPQEYEVLAHHYSEAAETEAARAYAIRAGDRLQKMASAEAARFYRTALAGWPADDLPGRAGLLAKLGYCLWITADTQAAMQVFTEAYTLFDAAGSRTQSGEMQRMIGRIYWEDADRQEALAHYRRAIAIHEQQPGTVEQARAISSMSQMHMLADENEQAIAWGRQAIDLAQRLGAEDVLVHALNNIGASMIHSGDGAAGFAYLHESLLRSLAAGLAPDALRAYFNLTGALHRKSRYAEELDILEQMAQLAEKVHAPNYIYLAYQRLCWVNWLIGNWSAALQYRGRVGQSRSPLYTAWTQRMFGEIDIDLGRCAAARHALEEGKASALKVNEIQTTLPHLHQLARVYDALGERAETEKTVQHIIDFVRRSRNISEDAILPMFFCGQWLAQQPGSPALEQARGCRAYLEQAFNIGGSPEGEAALAECSAVISLAEAQPAQAADHFQRAAHLWGQIQRRYDQARALTALAHARQTLREAPAAADALTQAVSIYEGLAAQLDAPDRAVFLETAPVARAMQPRRGPRADGAPLSRREMQVALLVRQGYSNRAIAGELFISERTVEKHVENILNRLGYHARAQIAAWVAAQGLDSPSDRSAP
jgi:DNA-binding CsgD family transcriptional regulator